MAGQTSVEKRRGILFVEVRLFDSGSRHYRSFGDTESVRAKVETWIRRTFTEIKIGTSVQQSQIASSPLGKETDQIEFTGHSRSQCFPDDTIYPLSDNDLEILIYSLFSDEKTPFDHEENESSDSPVHSFERKLLPHQAFEGLWQALKYEDPVGELTLRILSRAIQERKDHPAALSSQVKPWQSTVLLHGPPGSGKTALAQALAQRISIRLSKYFQVFELLQINSHTLFSRFYGETAQRIGALFSFVSELATDTDRLILVIFDEVESIAGSREMIAHKNEPGETIRATNELLKGLDRLKSCENVVMFFTSNLAFGLDAAFLDRCWVEREVDGPTAGCAFEMLRTEINNLIQRGVVRFQTPPHSIFPSGAKDGNGNMSYSEASSCTSMPLGIPSRQWASIHEPANMTTAVSELLRIARLGKGLSGRKLKGLVTRARYEYVVDEPGELGDLLQALEAVIRDKTRQHAGRGRGEGAKGGTTQEQAIETGEMERFLAELEAGGLEEMRD